MKIFGMHIHIRKKVTACLLTVTFLMSLFPAYNISFAEDSDVIKGNPISVYDPVTGCTYNYVNFSGQELVHPYQGHEAWTADGKSFLCGVPDKNSDGSYAHSGIIYLYNTETSEFTKVGKGLVNTSVTGVIGTDNCVYYSTGMAVNKYDIATKRTTVIIPSSYGFYPNAVTVSNDCNYIAFSSDNSNNHLWCEEGETAIFRYNIAEDKIEHHTYKFDYSNWINHHQMNPANPDIVFFAHDGLIGDGAGEIPSYNYLYDREWTVDFSTGEIKNVFKQGKTDADKCIVFTSHESWSSSGKYLYLNCYSNSAETGKDKCVVRCYPDGSHREYLRGADTGDRSADHAMATSDDKFTVVDTGKWVYLLSNDTYQQFPIYYSETSRYDPETGAARNHPYHPHPNVARNHYKVLWGIEHGGWGAANGGVVGVAWYDFTELAKSSAKGGIYKVNNTIDRVSYEGLDCESTETTYASKDCYYAATDKYLYFDINENVVDGTNESVTLSFDYYDNSTNDLVLTYTAGARTEAEDPYGNDLAASENASITIARTGTNKWMHKEIEIESGNFENINPYRTDFKVGGGDVYLANVEVSNVADGYAGGDGTKENPYQISNAAELRYFSNQVRETTDRTEVDSNLSYTATKVSDTTVTATYTPKRYHVFTDKYFELTADIDLCNEDFMPIGNLIYNFNGHFNGNGHVISNVNIDGTTPQAFERYAFFGATGANVEIKNLGIENLTNKFKGSKNKFATSIDGEDYKFEVRLVGAAGFVSSYAGGTFTNCYLKDVEVRDITQQMNSGGTGAFFGLGYGTVKATEANGYNAMTVTNCYVNGAILRAHSSATYGFIGSNMVPNTTAALITGDYIVTKTLNNCYTANISRGYYKTDGTLGSSSGTIYDSYMYPFTCTEKCTTYTDCYTASAGEKTTKTTNDDGTYTFAIETNNDFVLTTTDIETLNAGLVDHINYYADVKSVNDGYPILTDMSDPIIWDGIADKKPKGKGTEENPYLISTKEELVWFEKSVNTISDEGVDSGYTSEAESHFKLISDIDLEGKDWEPIGNSQIAFKGTFDGNGHVIKNFKIRSKTSNYEYAYKTADATEETSYCTDKIYKYNGFFGRTGSGSVVKNLGIENAEIKFYNHDYYYQFETDESGVITETGKTSIRALYNGGMVGSAGGKFINCYVKNSEVKNMQRMISDSGIGAFVGTASASSSFVGCYVKNVELCSSIYTTMGGFAATALKNSTFEDCYVADVVEESEYATNSSRESSIYGFAKATEGANVTNCFSTLADFESTTEENTHYNLAYSVGIISTANDQVTKEEITNGVTANGNLIPDTSDNFNDGYPICLWQNVLFKNYVFGTIKDGVSEQWFIADSVIDEVSFYKNRATSDCYMYTVLYDKTDNNRMVGCSIDFIDDELSEKSTHTIKLSTPITVPDADTARYALKLIFTNGETTFTPICDNFEYFE
ncbi:MAG: hypothetical protein IJC09_04910 [Clostridia bacterium]|nr:hypothetical protein [Clostridia bacterium]